MALPEPDAPAAGPTPGSDGRLADQPHGWREPRVRRALQAAVSILVVGGIFWFVLGQFADLSAVWRTMRSLNRFEVAVLVGLAAWNLAAYGIQMVVATPGLSYPQAMVLTESTTAVSNTLPAGGAIGVGLTYQILGSWGFSSSRATLAVLVSGVWNNFVKLGMPVVALAILAVQGEARGGRLAAALAGLVGLVAVVVIFALILRSEPFVRRLGLVTQGIATPIRRVFRMGPATGWDQAVVRFRGRVLGYVHRRWVGLTLVTIVCHLSLYLVLLASLRAMGVSGQQASWAEVLAVFSFARLVTAIPITPGGAGIVELALIAGITTAGDERAEVVAAVLVNRLLTYVAPIVIGGVTYLFWRRNRSWRDSAPPAPDWLTPSLAVMG
jgi:putative heme transporter